MNLKDIKISIISENDHILKDAKVVNAFAFYIFTFYLT